MAKTPKPKALERIADWDDGLWAWVKRVVFPRMGIWLYLTIALLAAVWWFAGHMLTVILYKAVLITLAAFLGDKVARFMEGSNKRPHELLEQARVLRENNLGSHWQHIEQRAENIYHRRAIIISAAMIAAALGS